MKIRVEGNYMLPERIDYIFASAPFEGARLFADDLERGANLPLTEHFSQPFARVIIRRQQIILRIEPKDHINGCAALGPGSNNSDRRKEQSAKRRKNSGFHAAFMRPNTA